MKLGFIGSGKMAGALVHGVVKAAVLPPEDILLSDVVPGAAAALARSTGASVAATNAEVAAGADTLILCVKPGDALAAVREMDTAGRLLISIAAGIPIAALQAAAPEARVVRVMPNTPALVHKGATAYALGTGITDGDVANVERIFGAVGLVMCVKESLLDAVTGLSGSGPAYVCVLIEALADGGVLMGLPRDMALKLAAQTLAGTAEMVLATGSHPGVLKDQVTSPGGTTIAGLEAMEKGAVRSALISAVRAATERSRELAKS